MDNQQDIMNMTSNPFLSLLGDSQSTPQGSGMPPELAQMMQGMGGAAPTTQPQAQPPQASGVSAQPGMEEEPAPDQFTKGQNPDRAKPLLSAIQALENYILDSTERDEILTARGIISLLTKLVARDQENMMNQ